MHVLFMSSIPTLLLLGKHDKAARLWSGVIGFNWSKDGFELFDQWFADLYAFVPMFEHELYSAACRLMIFLSSEKGAIDESDVDAWMPSPRKLADLERSSAWFYIGNVYDTTSMGAKAFLKLGRDDDAYELSRIAVSPEQKTEKHTTLVPCHSILGIVAARRGDLEEADGHFAKALEVAKLSRLPMLEVMAARDWKRHLLEPKGRDASGAEAVIDAACLKMKKTREQVAPVLSADIISG